MGTLRRTEAAMHATASFLLLSLSCSITSLTFYRLILWNSCGIFYTVRFSICYFGPGFVILRGKSNSMPVSFYIIAAIVFAIIASVFYREAVKYDKKEISGKERRPDLNRLGVLRPVLPLSLLVTVLLMLAVRYLFY